MSIFEKIKQFFKNIGNKQKLLESPKEREEVIGMSNSGNGKSEFLQDIKFDPKDLLDPRICRGDDMIPNILKTLGVNEDIIKNPVAIGQLKVCIESIMRNRGISTYDYDKQPTREQIDAIVKAIKSNEVLTSEQRNGEYHNLGQNQLKEYSGLSIDRETGNVIMQRFSIGYGDVPVGANRYTETALSSDGKGDVIETSSYSDIDTYKSSKDEYLSDKATITYNGDGIIVQREQLSYEQKNGENILTGHIKTKRDSQYPFIGKTENLISGEDSYYMINMERLETLEPAYKKDAEGKDIQPITRIKFDTRDEISSYYMENKDNIDASLDSPSVGSAFARRFGMRQKNIIKTGIRKLGIKAGIIPNEHEQDVEIVD